MNQDRVLSEPSRASVDALTGATLIEFGSASCGHCRAAQPAIASALAAHPEVRHIKLEDGPGRPLGRSFRVKLWPTLVFFRDGKERSRLVRPVEPQPVGEALAALVAG